MTAKRIFETLSDEIKACLNGLVAGHQSKTYAFYHCLHACFAVANVAVSVTFAYIYFTV